MLSWHDIILLSISWHDIILLPISWLYIPISSRRWGIKWHRCSFRIALVNLKGRYHDGHDIITYPISWHDITYPIITYPISWHDITYPISWHDITYPISWHDITYDIMISYIYRRYHHIAANISCQDKLPALNHLATKRYRIPCSKTKQQIDR